MLVSLMLVWVVCEAHPLEEFREAGFAVGLAHFAGHVAYGAVVGLIIGIGSAVYGQPAAARARVSIVEDDSDVRSRELPRDHVFLDDRRGVAIVEAGQIRRRLAGA